MDFFSSVLDYFRALSALPRPSGGEHLVRSWIIEWADQYGWAHHVDAAGNLLVIAPPAASHAHSSPVGLQSHMDMVCVGIRGKRPDLHGAVLQESQDILSADGTTLGADNGIGVAVMMALADISDRPPFELLFTVSEEIGLIGAQSLELPMTAEIAYNLDWSDSDTIGIGCGGTLLMTGVVPLAPFQKESGGQTFRIRIAGFKGGHSGIDIRHYIGNALLELIKVLRSLDLVGWYDISGGDADNALPRHATACIMSCQSINVLRNQLAHIQKNLRLQYKNPEITLTIDTASSSQMLCDTVALDEILDAGTGVQEWGPHNTPLSSWNLGMMKTHRDTLVVTYFLRSNQEDGIDLMRERLSADCPTMRWTLSHGSPVWISDPESPVVRSVQSLWVDEDGVSLPAVTTHATMEAGILAQKFPETTWVSLGATIHGMHTIDEHIFIRDFEVFAHRMRSLIGGPETDGCEG